MTKENHKFTKEEKDMLKGFKEHTEEMEMLQAMDLITNCDNPYQFAKTHSVYVKDWEKTKQQMLDSAENGNLPPGSNPAVVKEMAEIGEEIIQKKLEKVRDAFTDKFGESIYNYIGHDGKAKSCLGVVLFFVTIGTTIGFGEQIVGLLF